jgi:signal transduction histidine kinase
MDPLIVLFLLAGVGLGTSVWSMRASALSRRAAAAARAAASSAAGRADRAETVLGTVPLAWCRLAADGAVVLSPGASTLLDAAPKRRDGIADAFDETVRDAVAGLLAGKAPADGVERTFASRSGRRLGVTVADAGADRILWLRDVTEANSAERATGEALRAERARAAALAAALDAVPLPVWMRAADARIAWVNTAFAEAVEATPAEVVARQTEFDPRQGANLGRDALETGRAVAARQHLVVQGERHLFDITERPLDAEGTDFAGVGFAVDVTDIEDLQVELGRHIAGHAVVLEQLGSAIVIFGPEGRLRFHNQAYQRMSGLDEAWLGTDHSFGDVLEELRIRRRVPETADFPRWKKEMLGLFTSLIEPREDLLYLPDGTALRQLAVPHPFGGLMFISEDVTDRLQLESNYNTLVAVQRETLDSLAEGIAVFGSDGRMRLSNPAYRRVWNLREADVAGGQHLSDVLARLKGFFEDDRTWSAFAGRIRASALDREQSQGRIERQGGSVVQYATIPLPDGAVITSFLDVTDSARVEIALRQSNAALEAADRLKSEFIANVSYQLRTPLNAIMGFAEILRRAYFGPLNDRQVQYVDGMLESGERLLLLINDILDLATIEAGFMSLERGPMVPSDVLTKVAELTGEWAKKQKITLAVECEPDLPVMEADEKRIKQAVFNLVSNAIRFTPAGGRITLSARREGETVVLSVSDTGIGIPTHDHARVFERFERGHPDQSEPGAGLGLPLVRSFVELHGGRLRLDSAPGLGTRVDCIIPIKAPAAPDVALAAADGGRG